MKKTKFISLFSVIIFFTIHGCRYTPRSAGKQTTVVSAAVNPTILPSAAPPAPEISEGLDNLLEKKYRINLKYQNIPVSTWPELKYDKLDADDTVIPKYIKIFNSEFNKYSPEFISLTKLKSVAFVKNLTVDGQERAAAPDYYKEVLFLDIYLGKYDQKYQRHVIHHEFYHMIEEQLNGNPYFKDPDWAAFNPPDFNYGNGGKYERSDNAYPLTHPKTGFINIYSMSALEEDKAELYAALFTSGEDATVQKWISEGDAILAAKVNYLKDFLEKYGQQVGTAASK